MSRACLLQRNALDAGRIFRRVDVEKRIDRLVRPVGDGDTMPRDPNLDHAGARAGERHARAHLLPRLRDAKHVKVLTQAGEDFEVALEVTQKDVNELRDTALSVSETGNLRP